ncbi:hypothetical protein LTR65_003226 [Meristemomyces frigidus]
MFSSVTGTYSVEGAVGAAQVLAPTTTAAPSPTSSATAEPVCPDDAGTQYTDSNSFGYGVGCYTDFAGNDIGTPISETSFTACLPYCDTMSGCAGVEFNVAHNLCYLKSSFTGLQYSNTSVIYGMKNNAAPGNGLPSASNTITVTPSSISTMSLPSGATVTVTPTTTIYSVVPGGGYYTTGSTGYYYVYSTAPGSGSISASAPGGGSGSGGSVSLCYDCALTPTVVTTGGGNSATGSADGSSAASNTNARTCKPTPGTGTITVFTTSTVTSCGPQPTCPASGYLIGGGATQSGNVVVTTSGKSGSKITYTQIPTTTSTGGGSISSSGGSGGSGGGSGGSGSSASNGGSGNGGSGGGTQIITVSGTTTTATGSTTLPTCPPAAGELYTDGMGMQYYIECNTLFTDATIDTQTQDSLPGCIAACDMYNTMTFYMASQCLGVSWQSTQSTNNCLLKGGSTGIYQAGVESARLTTPYAGPGGGNGTSGRTGGTGGGSGLTTVIGGMRTIIGTMTAPPSLTTYVTGGQTTTIVRGGSTIVYTSGGQVVTTVSGGSTVISVSGGSTVVATVTATVTTGGATVTTGGATLTTGGATVTTGGGAGTGLPSCDQSDTYFCATSGLGSDKYCQDASGQIYTVTCGIQWLGPSVENTTAATLNDCEADCDAIPTCVAVSYIGGSCCLLVSGVTGIINNTNSLGAYKGLWAGGAPLGGEVITTVIGGQTIVSTYATGVGLATVFGTVTATGAGTGFGTGLGTETATGAGTGFGTGLGTVTATGAGTGIGTGLGTVTATGAGTGPGTGYGTEVSYGTSYVPSTVYGVSTAVSTVVSDGITEIMTYGVTTAISVVYIPETPTTVYAVSTAVSTYVSNGITVFSTYGVTTAVSIEYLPASTVTTTTVSISISVSISHDVSTATATATVAGPTATASAVAITITEGGGNEITVTAAPSVIYSYIYPSSSSSSFTCRTYATNYLNGAHGKVKREGKRRSIFDVDQVLADSEKVPRPGAVPVAWANAG